MGIDILALPDAHYAKTPEAIEAAKEVAKFGEVLRLDKAFQINPFGNHLGYILYGPKLASGRREVIGEFSNPKYIANPPKRKAETEG